MNQKVYVECNFKRSIETEGTFRGWQSPALQKKVISGSVHNRVIVTADH